MFIIWQYDKKSDGTDLITIPETATVRKLTPPEGYVGNYGYEYKWINSSGSKTTVRIHGIDATAPAGSNASQGWVVRIMYEKKSMDMHGNYHPPDIFKGSSPSYSPSIINDVHIPIEQPTVFPWVK
ncbi:polymorphic toxin type 30 domain-containing protein [Pectobacterium polonicum]|uniref:polymorphic toxin type 30 domain-containing protein n=1 Tax=Pectobacterium polonicum TaxID=2485124 RepID=UPI00142EBFAF